MTATTTAPCRDWARLMRSYPQRRSISVRHRSMHLPVLDSKKCLAAGRGTAPRSASWLGGAGAGGADPSVAGVASSFAGEPRLLWCTRLGVRPVPLGLKDWARSATEVSATSCASSASDRAGAMHRSESVASMHGRRVLPSAAAAPSLMSAPFSSADSVLVARYWARAWAPSPPLRPRALGRPAASLSTVLCITRSVESTATSAGLPGAPAPAS